MTVETLSSYVEKRNETRLNNFRDSATGTVMAREQVDKMLERISDESYLQDLCAMGEEISRIATHFLQKRKSIADTINI